MLLLLQSIKKTFLTDLQSQANALYLILFFKFLFWAMAVNHMEMFNRNSEQSIPSATSRIGRIAISIIAIIIIIS